MLTNRYEIQELVAQDETGVLYRVRDRQDGGVAALWRFFPMGAGGGGFQEDERVAYRGTVEALRQLRHPSLCGVLDGLVDEVDGIPQLVTEWAEGERLSEVLTQRTLAPEEAVALAGQGLEVIELLGQFFGEEAEWLEMEPGAVVIDLDRFVCRFRICPLQVLGVGERDGGVQGLGYLVEHVMGWEGRVVPSASAGGLGGWVARAKEGGWPVSEAMKALIKVRAVWTGEEVPREEALGEVPAAAATAGAGATAVVLPRALAPPPPQVQVYQKPAVGSSGAWLGMVGVGVVVLGMAGWLLVKKPWESRPQIREDSSSRVVVAEGRTASSLAAAETRGSSAVLREEGQLSAQERIDRQFRETSKEMGLVVNEDGEVEAKKPRVFSPEDGAAMRNWLGEEVVLEGRVARVRASTSGKTRYIEFSDELGKDVVCARFSGKPGKKDSLAELKKLLGQTCRFRGEAKIERGTGRIVLHLERRDQIEVID